uniref:Synaptotagmin-12 n=1 Tax=Magallana gigas TaxID=29159 RepID=K1QM20_MAGGI
MPIKMWLNLRDIDEKPTEYGDIMFSLSYLPTAERLTIVIVKARNLKWADPARDSGGKDVVCFIIRFCFEHRTEITRRYISLYVLSLSIYM